MYRKQKDFFGFNKAINWNKLKNPKVLKELEKICEKKLTSDKLKRQASRKDNMKKVETEKYKDYTIEVYEQEPNVEYPLNENDWDDLDPDCLGTHAYKVFDKENELIYEDKTHMWDIGACLENAKLDLDMDIQQANEQKG